MKMFRFCMTIGLGFSLLAIPFVNGASAVDTKILKIGNTVPMKTKEGIQIKKWLELLSERVNNSGGLKVKGETYKIEIISYDDEYSPDTGRAAAERLIYNDKVKHIICQWGSAPIVATLGVAEQNKVLQIGNGMTEKTMDPKYHYYYRTPSLFFFKGAHSTFLKEFKERGLPMTVVQINPDDITGRGSSKQYSVLYKNLGVKVLDSLFYKRGTTDYIPFATKIKSLNPGFVDTGTTPAGGPTINLAKALYDVGYKGGRIFLNMSGSWRDIVKKFGPEVIEGTVGIFKDPRDYQTEQWILETCDAYEKKYGVWESDSVNWISGWFALMTAIKKADSLDVDDLTKAMDGMEFDAIYYKARFVARPDKKNSRTCDSAGQVFPGMMENGKFTIMKTVSPDENYKASIRAFGLQEAYGIK